MEIPKNISFKKVGKKGGKLMVTFTSDDMPDYIWIKGTEDLTRVRKNKKIWVSRFKYDSLGVTLNPIDDQAGILEQAYSPSGSAIIDNPNKASIGSFTHDVTADGVISLDWGLYEQLNLNLITLSRQNSPNDEYTDLKRYQNTDTYHYSESEPSGSYNYQLTAVFNDGSSSIIWIENVVV